mgnify:CR=1 FL=1
MKEAKKGGSGTRLGAIVAIALAAGGAAGLGLVYATGGFHGKAGETIAQAAACPVDAQRKARLDAATGGEIAALSMRDEGVPVSTIAFNDGAGKAMSLGDFSGKALLVNLWATWCAPCRAEMPALDALQKQMGGDSFAVVAISMDAGDHAKPKAFYEEIGIKNLALYHDGSMASFNALKKETLLFGLPTTLIVDERGCVIANMSGPAEWASPDALRFVEALKAGP